MFTKEFNLISKNDTASAGGKGASLGEMTQAGIPVPPGFVVLAGAFDSFFADLDGAVSAILNKVDFQDQDSIEKASSQIREMIKQKDFPAETENEIIKQFEKLGAEFVAVRSSATAEDSSAASWAGELESYLNIGKEDLQAAVKKCWSSLFTPRAIFYRFENNLQNQKVSVAVAVQAMVQSEVAGIAFTVHPLTADENQMVIEAGYGLGEAVVGGKITPDAYVFDKRDKIIAEKKISSQSIKISGMAEKAVEKEIQDKQKLPDEKIAELARICLDIEKHYGAPQDIEWAMADGKIYIVQSRPITAFNRQEPGILNYIKSQKWFFGVRADESLLFYSAKQNGCAKFMKKEHGIESAETMLIPLKKDYPIRVFNLYQAKQFHAVSEQKILSDPQILVSYVEKDDQLYREMEACGQEMAKAAEEDKYAEAVGSFQKLMDLYNLSGAYFMLIFSFGLKLAENKDKLGDIGDVIKKHDDWRNSVAFKEEAMGENLFYFFRYILKKKGLKTDPLLFMRFLTQGEIEEWLSEKMIDSQVEEKINLRQENGFVYLGLRNENKEILDDPAEIGEIQQYFLKLDEELKKPKTAGQLEGQTAFGSDALRGEVLIIKDKSELKDKARLIGGKILIAIQTTPHFIPYLKEAKAIVTDEGGLTCHAAIVAREMGIPCLVGTKSATQTFKDGDEAEIVFSQGTIKKI